MAQSSNEQTDTEALWLWEGPPICPWISGAAPLTHIHRPEPQGAYCPLLDSQKTTVNYLKHERTSTVFKAPNKTKLKVRLLLRLRFTHLFLEQINTAGGRRKLLIAGGLKPVANVVEWNRINQIPTPVHCQRQQGTAQDCEATIAEQLFVSVKEGSPAWSDTFND